MDEVSEKEFDAEPDEDNMEEDVDEDCDDDGEEGEGALEIHTSDTVVKDSGKKKGKRGLKKAGKTSLSGRGVTLKMLLDDNVLAVEKGCMSIDYLVS